MKKKFLILIVILILGGLILSACSGGSFLEDNAKISGTVTTNHQREYIEASSQSNNKTLKNMRFNSKRKKFIDDEIIIKYNDSVSVSSLNNGIAKSGSKELKKIRTNNGELIKIKIPSNKTVEEMVEYYNQQPGVEYAEPNYIAYSQAVPNDTYYEEGFDNSIGQWGLWATNMELAWEQQLKSGSVTVAVLDSGIVRDHDDLEGNISGGGNLVVNSGSNSDPRDYTADTDIKDRTNESNGGSHGTHVAGIIGALTNNSTGVAGVSWGIDLMPVKVLDDTQSGNTFDIAEGIYFAVDNGADILNMSLGVNLDSAPPVHLTEAIEFADSKDKILVAASGNIEDDETSVFYPAAYPEVIAVGAVDTTNKQTDYSTFGPELDLVAPGGNAINGILSTWGYYENGKFYSNRYAYINGTSMSTAYVSGAAALLLEAGVSPANIKNRLTSTAFDLGTFGKDDNYGYGMLDVYAALRNKKTKPPIVFLAEIDGGELFPLANTEVEVNSEGEYAIAEEVEGQYYLVAWKNTNNNDLIDQGDYYGISPDPDVSGGIYFQPGEMVKEDLDIFYVYAETNTSAPSISAANIEKLRD